MSNVVDWAQAAVEWTEDGFELSAPLHPAVTTRQAKTIADAVESAVRAAYGPAIEVSFVGPEDSSAADLLITSPTLLHLDPGLLRATVDDAANRAANEAVGVEGREVQAAAAWLHAVQTAR